MCVVFVCVYASLYPSVSLKHTHTHAHITLMFANSGKMDGKSWDTEIKCKCQLTEANDS